jgi:hypothetical protein
MTTKFPNCTPQDLVAELEQMLGQSTCYRIAGSAG